MGNHKGRSKGYEAKPTCLRCSKSKITCLGYRDCFVNDRDPAPRNKSPTHIQPKNSPSQTDYGNHNTALVKQASDVPYASRIAHRPHPPLSLFPWKDDIMISYLIENLRAGPMSAVCQNVATSQMSVPVSPQRQTAKQCLLALATVLYGVNHLEDSLLIDGRQRYGQALQMVTRTINNSTGLQITQIMASVYALSLLESVLPSNSLHITWVQHIFGLEQLCKFRGPSLDVPDPLFDALLDSTRLTMIVAALHDHRPSLMAQPEWSAVNMCSPQEDPALLEIAYILDFLAQLTTLHPELDKLVSVPETPSLTTMDSSSRIRALLDRSLGLLASVKNRRTEWLKFQPLSEYSAPPGPHVNSYSSHLYPFESTIQFTSTDAANSFILHYTTVILVHQFALSVAQILPISERNILESDLLAARHISSAVEQISKGIDYKLQATRHTPPSGSAASASSYLILPVRVAFKAIAESTSAEHVALKPWLADVFALAVTKVSPWTSNKHLYQLTSNGNK